MKMPPWHKPKKIAISCMKPLRNRQRMNFGDPLEYMPNSDVSESTHNRGWRILLDRKVSDKFTLVCLIPNEPYEMKEQGGYTRIGNDVWSNGIRKFKNDHSDRTDVVFITPDQQKEDICTLFVNV